MRRTLLGTTGLAALLAFGGAAAQEVELPVTQFDTVTTVGSKTPKTLLEILGSESVIERDEIEREIPSKLGDILTRLPGVDAVGGPRSMAEEFNIRGLGDSRIVMRIDGARANFQSGHRGRVFLDPDFLRRVEVVRGPSSIYGSGALGGVLALETVDPKDLLDPGKTFGARAKLGVQSVNREMYQNYSAFGQYGKFGALAGFSRRISGDIRVGDTPGSFGGDSRSRVPFSKDNVKSGLAKLTFDSGTGHTGFFSFQIYNNDGFIPTAANTDSRDIVADRTSREERMVWGYNFNPAGNDFFDLTTRVYWNRVHLTENVVSPGANFGRLDTTRLGTVGMDVYNTSRADVWGDWMKLALTYGVEYYRDSQTGERNGQMRQQYPDASSGLFGAYLHGDFTIMEQFIVSGTLRWDHFSLNASGQRGRTETSLSKSFGLGWRPTDWLLVYGKYAEAFRAPSLTETYARGVHFPLGALGNNEFIPNPDLKPERAKSFEGGVALQFRNLWLKNDRLSGRISVYQKDVKDFIDLEVIANVTFIPFPGPGLICQPCTTQAINIRDARIFGTEAELTYTSPWVFGSIGAAYNIGQNMTDKTSLRSVPQHKLVTVLGGRIPQWDLMFGWRGTAMSGQNRVPDGTTRTPGTYVNDVFASWVPSGRNVPWLKGFRFDVGIDNIFDRRYRRHLAELPEAGRNFKMAVSYTIQFGGPRTN